MKKLFFFAAMLAALTVNAQTIVMDGDNADWADVPMLSDPGAMPLFKMVVPQAGLTLPTGAAICVMTQVTDAQKTTYPGYPVVYVDADKSNTTKSADEWGDAWYCPAFGPDYEMATWDDGNTVGVNADETIHEMTIVQSNFTGIPFAGDCHTWMLFNWTKYMPNSPDNNVDGTDWKWSENDYHPIIVKPYSYANLNGTHAVADIYSSHEALTPASPLNMFVGYGYAVELWASWAVELTNPAIYDIKANIVSTNTASVDLKLVNVATNEVAATFASGDLAEGAAVQVGSWDLSAVPAGKYMLRFSNHVQWSEMQLNSLTLSAEVTGVENVNSDVQTTKVIRNGQVLIVRDGKTYNALGAEMK